METDEKPRRGRPRPAESINRDHQILTRLKEAGPRTRNQLADDLGLSTSLVYLALSRLRDRGVIKRCLGADGVSVWSAAVEEPCE
jgi:predicted ArsR family transcriptional regulator